MVAFCFIIFFFSSRRRHTRFSRDWSSDVCSSDLWWDRLSPRARPAFRHGAASEMPDGTIVIASYRSEERREGKSVDLGGRRIIKKKKEKSKKVKYKKEVEK